MKRLFISFLCGLVFLTSIPAKGNADDFSVFVAAGPLYMLPGSVRFGTDTWEFGLLNPYTLGFNKNFRKINYYFSFGLATTMFEISFGPFGAVGFEFNMFSKFNVRGEVNSVANINGVSLGSALIGLSVNF